MNARRPLPDLTPAARLDVAKSKRIEQLERVAKGLGVPFDPASVGTITFPGRQPARREAMEAWLLQRQMPYEPADEEERRILRAIFAPCPPKRRVVRRVRHEDRPRADPRDAIVYFVAMGDTGLVKIGTTRNLKKRLTALQNGAPVRLRVLATVPGGAEIERRLHQQYAADRREGEWFQLSARMDRHILRLADRDRRRGEAW